MIGKSRTSLRGLRTFCSAARHESFRLAGEELFITSSAVSHQIKSLEEELDVRLFDRSSRELKLTESGATLYADINPLIEQIDSAVSDFRNSDRRISVRMSIQPFFASEYFVPRLTEYTDRHVDVNIQVDTSDESSERHPVDTDVSIRLFSSPPYGVQSYELFPLRMVPAGSAAFKSTINLEKRSITSDFPLIVHESYPLAWKQWAKSAGIALKPDCKISRFGSMIAVVRAAERGLGAALVPVPLADQWFEQGTIVRLFDDELVTDLSYYLVRGENRTRCDAIDELCDWILREFGRPA